jgi:hypothetical protein
VEEKTGGVAANTIAVRKMQMKVEDHVESHLKLQTDGAYRERIVEKSARIKR